MVVSILRNSHLSLTAGSARTGGARRGRRHMAELALKEATIIVDQALERGRALGLAPLTVVVLDAGGHLKAAKREDASSLLRPEIADGQGVGCLGHGLRRPRIGAPRRALAAILCRPRGAGPGSHGAGCG